MVVDLRKKQKSKISWDCLFKYRTYQIIINSTGTDTATMFYNIKGTLKPTKVCQISIGMGEYLKTETLTYNLHI
jgi:hypothetical protein